MGDNQIPMKPKETIRAFPAPLKTFTQPYNPIIQSKDSKDMENNKDQKFRVFATKIVNGSLRRQDFQMLPPVNESEAQRIVNAYNSDPNQNRYASFGHKSYVAAYEKAN